MAMPVIVNDSNRSGHSYETPQDLHELLWERQMNANGTCLGDKMFSKSRTDINEEIDYYYAQFMYYQKLYAYDLPERAFHYILDLDSRECEVMGINTNSVSREDYKHNLLFFLRSEFMAQHQKIIYIQEENSDNCRIHIIVNPVDIYHNCGCTEMMGCTQLQWYINKILKTEKEVTPI